MKPRPRGFRAPCGTALASALLAAANAMGQPAGGVGPAPDPGTIVPSVIIAILCIAAAIGLNVLSSRRTHRD